MKRVDLEIRAPIGMIYDIVWKRRSNFDAVWDDLYDQVAPTITEINGGVVEQINEELNETMR